MKRSDSVDEYPKSYKGLVIWLVLFLASVFFIPAIPVKTDTEMSVLIINNLMAVFIAILTYMIYRNEKIYWYNGIEYEDAKKASSEQRKDYAWRHFKRFAIFAAANFIYSLIAYITPIPYGFSIAVTAIGICAIAISTINIKFKND